MGLDAMLLDFWMLSFKPAFLLSSFSFIKRLFSYFLRSAIRVVSSACLRLLIFPLAILISTCASSNPAFHVMYSAYKLNKQDDNIQPWRSSFPIWNQSVVPCSVLAVASWPAYKFIKRQIRWSCIPISFRIFHSLLWSTQSKALLSSRGSLVPLHFLPWGRHHLHIWDYWYFSQQCWFQFVLHPAHHFMWCTLHIS